MIMDQKKYSKIDVDKKKNRQKSFKVKNNKNCLKIVCKQRDRKKNSEKNRSKKWVKTWM